jgi:outer membrane protein, multidrug efflux system
MLIPTKQFTTSAWAGIALLGAVSLLETGCNVGPNYHTPKVVTPAEWAMTLAGGETNYPGDLAVWWKSFGDSELDSLVATAISSNLTLRVAEARIRQARAERGIIAANEGPSIGTEASYSRNRFGVNGFPPLPPDTPFDFNLYSAGFDAAWEVDIFGGTRRAVEAADAQILAAKFGRDDVLRSLLGDVAGNYIQARVFQQRLVITKRNIEAQQRIVDLTRDQLRTGLTTELNLREAEALLTSTEAQVPSLETGFQTATYRLDVLLGRMPGHLASELATASSIPIAPPEVPVGLPSDLLLRRPDIRSAERKLAATTARIGEAKADFFPKFSLTGDIGLTSIRASDWWTAGSRFWSAGPTVVWPIFESGRIRSNVHLQTAKEEEAFSQYQQSILVAFEDVSGSLTAYAKEQIRRRSLSQSVEANQKALKLSESLYRRGLSDFLHVLNSERGLYQSQDALVQSDGFVALNLVALYKALGGGWQDDSIPNKEPLASAK